MIDSVYMKKDFRSLKAKELFVFNEGVNLLVGEQGAGKSSLLRLIAAAAKLNKAFIRGPIIKADEYITLERIGPPRPIFAYDYEGDNPRTSVAIGMFGMITSAAGVNAMFGSHGEFTRGLNEQIGRMYGHYLILDEPDSGLSPRSALKLVRSLKRTAANGSQIIAAVHNPWVIGEFETVYDMTARMSKQANNYLNEQRDIPAEGV